MKTVQIVSPKEIPYCRNLTLCLGFFDALHSDHRKLIERGRRFSSPLGVLTFSENPLKLLKGEDCSVISSLEMKKEILSDEGVDFLFILNLSWDILNLNNETFIEEILLPLGVKNIVCGFDYSFGKGGKGKPKDLIDSGKFHVEVVDEVKNERNEKISSSMIRSLIRSGKTEEAAIYLCRPYQIRGTVSSGFHVGRTISYKTANIEMSDRFELPCNGVYATEIEIESKRYRSMTNIGYHPTVNALRKPGIETNIFDFDENIYGKKVKLFFYRKIRDEKKFDSLEDLKNQLESDEIQTREYFLQEKRND